MAATRKRIIRVSIISLLLIGLAIAVPLLAVLNTKVASSRLKGGIQNYEGEIPPDGYSVQVNVSSFSPQTGVSSLHFIIAHLADGDVIPTNSSMQLIANSKSSNFSRFDFVPQVDITYTAIASTSNNYPFDTYDIQGTFGLVGTDGPLTSNTYLLASIDQWTIDSSLDSGYNGSVIISLHFKRTQIIQFFALFIACLMWALSASALILSSTIWIRHRKVEPPTIAVVGALLFALPAMRNGLPGTPALGVTYDVASYFWNMLMVAISVIMLMWNYILRYQSENRQSKKPSLESTRVDLNSPFLA